VYYVPATDHAYDTVQYIQHEVWGGWFVRGLHHWGASAVMMAIGLHMLQVFFDGAYKRPRELMWIVGVILLAIIRKQVRGAGSEHLLHLFTGQLNRAEKAVGMDRSCRVQTVGLQQHDKSDGDHRQGCHHLEQGKTGLGSHIFHNGTRPLLNSEVGITLDDLHPPAYRRRGDRNDPRLIILNVDERGFNEPAGGDPDPACTFQDFPLTGVDHIGDGRLAQFQLTNLIVRYVGPFRTEIGNRYSVCVEVHIHPVESSQRNSPASGQLYQHGDLPRILMDPRAGNVGEPGNCKTDQKGQYSDDDDDLQEGKAVFGSMDT